jgi:hypothetical protein
VRLEREVRRFIEELRSASEHCERPTIDGNKCAQCYERLAVARRLEFILIDLSDTWKAERLSDFDKRMLAQCRIDPT